MDLNSNRSNQPVNRSEPVERELLNLFEFGFEFNRSFGLTGWEKNLAVDCCGIHSLSEVSLLGSEQKAWGEFLFNCCSASTFRDPAAAMVCRSMIMLVANLNAPSDKS